MATLKHAFEAGNMKGELLYKYEQMLLLICLHHPAVIVAIDYVP